MSSHIKEHSLKSSGANDKMPINHKQLETTLSARAAALTRAQANLIKFIASLRTSASAFLCPKTAALLRDERVPEPEDNRFTAAAHLGRRRGLVGAHLAGDGGRSYSAHGGR